MEGASLEHALRLLRGQPLYAAPSGEFIAFVYPPLSYIPMALSAWLFGPTLWAARLPSLLFELVALLGMQRAASRLAGHAWAGLLAAGLYALGYGYSGGFVDLARVDALFMALVILGCERMTAERSQASLAYFALSCLAKQHGMFFLGAATLHAFRTRSVPWQRIVLIWAGLLLTVLALDWSSAGWFLTYTFTVPRKHGLDPALLLSFVVVDLCAYLPVLVGLTLVAIVRRRALPLRGCDLLLAAGVVASALGRAHPGGADNVRLPAYALMCLIAAVAFCDLMTRRALAPLQQVALSSGLLLQVGMLWQPPSMYQPNARTQQAFARLHAELTRCAGGGPSVALDHTRITGTSFAHLLALSDLIRNHDAVGMQAANAVAAALDAPDAPRAVAASGIFKPLEAAIARRYALCATLPAMRLPTGFAPQTTRVYRRVH